MPPAKMPYVQQRDKKIDSLIAAADMERLNAIGKEWPTTIDSGHSASNNFESSSARIFVVQATLRAHRRNI